MPGPGGPPDRSRPRLARRAFLTGPLFRPTAGAVSSGACCRTINHHARGRRLMRIAYVCADPGVPVFGRKGCSVHVQEVVRAFRGCGARVELFATCRGGEPPPDLRAVPVHPLPAVPKGDLATRERAALALNGELD